MESSGSRVSRGNLPSEPTSFVGRRRDISQAVRLLRRARLVTFTGVAGVGKSRLAVRVAAAVAKSFHDGTWLVELAPLQDPALLPQALVNTLPLQDQVQRDPITVLIDFLRGKRLLLVLDNCEHLLDTCASLVTELLRAAHDVRVLVTSRQPLTVDGEYLQVVEPLPVPDLDNGKAEARRWRQQAAVVLFAHRAASAEPGFAVTARNLPAVARVCRRLDGLPLAIELAAVRVRWSTVEEIAAQLDDRFRLSAAETLPALPHHRTLRAAVDWSFELCTAEEQRLWARASVFAGSFELTAAEVVCSADDLRSELVYDVIAGLVDKSVLTSKDSGGTIRYRLLETLRQYGREELDKADEGPVLQRRHRDYYLRIAERFDAEWFGPHQVQWARLMHEELPNLRAALSYCLSAPEQTGVGLRLVRALNYLWIWLGAAREGRLWMERALAADRRPGRDRARTLTIYSRLLLTQGHVDAAAEPARECMDLVRYLDDDFMRADALLVRGLQLIFCDDVTAGLPLLDAAVKLVEKLDDRPMAVAFAKMFRGLGAVYEGDGVLADELFAEAAATCRAHGDRWMLAYCLINAVPAALLAGDTARGVSLAREALPLSQAVHDALGLTLALEYLAWAAGQQRQPRRAARLLGAAQSQFEALGGSPLTGGRYRQAHEECEAWSRVELGDRDFAAERERGQKMTLAEAAAYAVTV